MGLIINPYRYQRPKLTYLYSEQKAGTSASPAFTGLPFGAADPKRSLVVVTGVNRSTASSINVTSMTIGGVAGNPVSDGVNNAVTYVTGTNRVRLEMWYAPVPTGTSGDVTINYSAAIASGSAVMGLFSLYGANMQASSIIRLADSANLSQSMSPFGRAALIAFALSDPITWTNATQVFNFSTGGLMPAAAINQDFPTAASTTVGMSSASGSNVYGLIAATFVSG